MEDVDQKKLSMVKWSAVTFVNEVTVCGGELHFWISYRTFFFWSNFQSKEASYDRLISTDICELGHGLCRRIAFVLERSGGAVRKFPKLCNSQPAHQQKPELPETKWEFTFLQLWNEKRAKKNPQNCRMIKQQSTKSFKCDVINVAKRLVCCWDIWLKTMLNFSPQTPFPVNDMITNFGFLGRVNQGHCSTCTVSSAHALLCFSRALK